MEEIQGWSWFGTLSRLYHSIEVLLSDGDGLRPNFMLHGDTTLQFRAKYCPCFLRILMRKRHRLDVVLPSVVYGPQGPAPVTPVHNLPIHAPSFSVSSESGDEALFSILSCLRCPFSPIVRRALLASSDNFWPSL